MTKTEYRDWLLSIKDYVNLKAICEQVGVNHSNLQRFVVSGVDSVISLRKLQSLNEFISNLDVGYIEKKREYQLVEIIIDALNLHNIAQNILNTNQNKFERFFEKIYSINKRFLYLYIRNNKNSISKQQLEFATKYYQTRGVDVRWD